MDPHTAAPAPEPSRRTERERQGLGLPLGRLFGAPVRLSLAWLPLGALVTFLYGQNVLVDRPALPAPVGYVVGAGFALCLVVSVLLHEVGHAVMSQRLGMGVRGITVEALGGYTETEREAPKPAAELLVSLAGPVTSLGLGIVAGLAAAVAPPGTLAEQLAAQTAFANLVVAAVNALPGLPLDGGRALQAVVWAATGDRPRGQRVAGWSGRAIAGFCLVAAVTLYTSELLSLVGMLVTVLISFTIWTGAGQAIGAAALTDRLTGFDVARLSRPMVAVLSGTTLAEARWTVAQSGLADPVIAVASPDGQVLGVLHPEAVAAVPAERRSRISVDSLVRHLTPGHVVETGLCGLELLRAVGHDPSADYLVVQDEDVIGVLRGAELTTLLESAGLVSRRTPR